MAIFSASCLQRHTVEKKQARRGKGDEKSLTLRHRKRTCYDPPTQNSSIPTVSLPSGEYRYEQSRHCKVFSAPFPRLHANASVTTIPLLIPSDFCFDPFDPLWYALPCLAGDLKYLQLRIQGQGISPDLFNIYFQMRRQVHLVQQ